MEEAKTLWSGLQPLDVAVGGVLVYFALRGWLRGFVGEVLALTALVLAAAAAFRWTPDAVAHFADTIPGPASADAAISFLFVFGISGLGFRVLARVVEQTVTANRGSVLNRLGGAMFGLCKGGVALGCAVMLVRTFAPEPALRGEDTRGKGAVERLNARLAESPAAAELADVADGLISMLVDAAEIRLRMLVTSDNEGA
jgi:membrane protein required for colicin V production